MIVEKQIKEQEIKNANEKDAKKDVKDILKSKKLNTVNLNIFKKFFERSSKKQYIDYMGEGNPKLKAKVSLVYRLPKHIMEWTQRTLSAILYGMRFIYSKMSKAGGFAYPKPKKKWK